MRIDGRVEVTDAIPSTLQKNVQLCEQAGVASLRLVLILFPSVTVTVFRF
jgi:hypothetical protein